MYDSVEITLNLVWVLGSDRKWFGYLDFYTFTSFLTFSSRVVAKDGGGMMENHWPQSIPKLHSVSALTQSKPTPNIHSLEESAQLIYLGSAQFVLKGIKETH